MRRRAARSILQYEAYKWGPDRRYVLTGKPRAIDEYVDMGILIACAHNHLERSFCVARREYTARRAWSQGRVDDCDGMKRSGNARPRPSGRRDETTSLDHRRNTFGAGTKHGTFAIELRIADVPGIGERHAATRPCRIYLVRDDDTAVSPLERHGDRRADITRSDYDGHRPVVSIIRMHEHRSKKWAAWRGEAARAGYPRPEEFARTA